MFLSFSVNLVGLFCFRAEALQSIVQLLGEKELYDFWADQYRVHRINWNQEKARDVLEAWQREFVKVCIFARNINSIATN